MRSSPSLRRRLRRSIAAVSALALTAAACGGGGDTTTPATDDTPAPTIDPATTTDESSSTTPTTDSGTTTPTTNAPSGPETSDDRATTTTSDDATSTTSSTASPTSSTTSTSTTTSTTTTTSPTTSTTSTTTTTTSPDDGEPPLRRGDENELVSFWQDRLNRWLELAGSDTFPIAVDGIFGPQTEGATIEFQNAAGVDADGVVDPIDRVALEDAITALEAGGGSPGDSALAAIDVVSSGDRQESSVFGIRLGAGGIDVGAEIEAINDVLGQPTGDTGWLPMPTEELPCKRDTEHREVVWNDLRLSFERGANGPNLGAWNLGPAPEGFIAPENPTPLQGRSNVTTLEGVGVGSPRSALDSYESYLDDGFAVPSGSLVVGFDLVDDRVVGISSGPLDCFDPDDPNV